MQSHACQTVLTSATWLRPSPFCGSHCSRRLLRTSQERSVERHKTLRWAPQHAHLYPELALQPVVLHGLGKPRLLLIRSVALQMRMQMLTTEPLLSTSQHEPEEDELATGAATLAIADEPITDERFNTFRTTLGQLLNSALFEDDSAGLDAIIHAVNAKLHSRSGGAFDKEEAVKALRKMDDLNQIMYTSGDLVYKI
ncbi:hypothetical protein HYQ46_006755 [Verticillium longisporum]|nr:hypothetical protein HYQ46_006755 [Verticillium longisporum]